jgi:predicted transposase YbfD/YdcC
MVDLDPYWRQRFGLRHPGGPHQATLSRVFAAVDVGAFEAALSEWTQAVLARALTAPVPGSPRVPLPRPTAASDGKTLCGSATAATPGTHLLSLFAVQFGCVLAQRAVASKTNEITVAPELLADFALDGWLVTTDALLTQRELDSLILARGGDYFHPVKGNQPGLLRDIRDLFSSPLLNATVQTAVTTELVGNRIVQRAVNCSPALNQYSTWPGVGQVVELWRVVTDKPTKHVHSERAYAITSLRPGECSPAQVLAVWQAHWGIENRLHWVRDVTLGEDASRVHKGSGPQVLAASRNAALTWLRSKGEPNIAQAVRHYAKYPVLAFIAVGLPIG